MKKNYTIKTILCLGILAFTLQQTFAQIRIVEVHPSTNEVTLHNYGSANNPQDISSYWFCARFAYSQVSDATVLSGSTDLAIGAEVVLTLSGSLNTTSSDLGFYSTPSFGSSSAMEDFMQYGGGGIGRENVAVTKGIWTAGTFINLTPPYSYFGDGAQNGFQFWDTVLGINDFNTTSSLNLYPNPTHSLLNIELNNNYEGAIITFQIFDVLGKQVIHRSANSEDLSTVDVSKLEKGLYLIKITSGDQSEIKRFIKD